MSCCSILRNFQPNERNIYENFMGKVLSSPRIPEVNQFSVVLVVLSPFLGSMENLFWAGRKGKHRVLFSQIC